MAIEAGQVRGRLADQRIADIQYEMLEQQAAMFAAYFRAAGLGPEVAEAAGRRLAEPGAQAVANPERAAAIQRAQAMPPDAGHLLFGGNDRRAAAIQAAEALPAFINAPNMRQQPAVGVAQAAPNPAVDRFNAARALRPLRRGAQPAPNPAQAQPQRIPNPARDDAQRAFEAFVLGNPARQPREGYRPDDPNYPGFLALLNARNAIPEFINQPPQNPAQGEIKERDEARQQPGPWGNDQAPPRQAALDPAQLAAYRLANTTPPGMNAEQLAAYRRANGIPEYADPTQAFNESREQSRLGAQRFPENVGAYMNPYQQRVVDQIRNEGLRTFHEGVMPALDAKFVRAGTHGGSRHATLAERAGRDVQNLIAEQQGKALHAGYGQAAQIFNSDQLRRLANAENQKGLGLSGQASNLANIGALTEAGGMQHGHHQQRLDIGFQDWMRQREEPFTRIAQQSALMGNQNFPMTQDSFNYRPPEAHLNRWAQGAGVMGQLLGGLLQQPRARYKHGGRVTLNLGRR